MSLFLMFAWFIFDLNLKLRQMKKVLFLIGMVVMASNLIFGSCKIYNYTDANSTLLFEKIFALVSKDLGIDTCNIEIIICYSIFDDASNVYGATIRRHSSNIYIMNLGEYISERDKPVIFMHELVHISQIEHSRLIIHKCSVWFEGKAYTNNIAYEDRAYEKEAIEKSCELYKKYKKEIK